MADSSEADEVTGPNADVPPWNRDGAVVTVIVLYQVDVDVRRLRGWRDGPTTFEVAMADRAGAETTDSDRTYRGAMILPPVARVLYGTGRDSHRKHLAPISTVLRFGRLEVRPTALELLVAERAATATATYRGWRPGVLALHLDVPDRLWPLDSSSGSLVIVQGLKALARNLSEPLDGVLGWRLPSAVQAMVGEGVRAASGFDNALLAVHLAPAEGSGRWRDVMAIDPWMWSLAMASPSRAPTLPSDDSERGTAIELPQSHVTIVRHGVVFRTTVGGDAFRADSESGRDRNRFRTIYLDGLLLVWMQTRLISRLAAEVADLRDPRRAGGRFRRISQDFRALRASWWWRTYSRWVQPDRVVSEVRRLLDVEARYAELREDHEFFAEMIETDSTSRLNRWVIFLTILGLAGTAADILGLVGNEDVVCARVGWLGLGRFVQPMAAGSCRAVIAVLVPLVLVMLIGFGQLLGRVGRTSSRRGRR